MTNDDYHKAYRRASLQLHPDKCQGDAEQKALTTKLFQKANAAKELLTVDETDPTAVAERQSIIRRYLWYEHERAMTEPSPEDDQTLANFQAHLKRTGPTTTGRVLPGVGLLHAALLQCFRDRRRGGRKSSIAPHHS